MSDSASVSRMFDPRSVGAETMVATAAAAAVGCGRSATESAGIRKILEKLLEGRLRIEADRFGVAADERPPEQARGPLAHVVAFKGFEQAGFHFRAGGDVGDVDIPAFPLPAQTCAEAIRHDRSNLGAASGVDQPMLIT